MSSGNRYTETKLVNFDEVGNVIGEQEFHAALHSEDETSTNTARGRKRKPKRTSPVAEPTRKSTRLLGKSIAIPSKDDDNANQGDEESDESRNPNEAQSAKRNESERIALQIEKEQMEKAELVKKSLEEAERARKSGKNELNKEEAISIAKARETLGKLQQVIKEAKYNVSDHELHVMIEYGEKKEISKLEDLLLFLDGYRCGYERGGNGKEIELVKITESLSKTHKEFSEYGKNQSNYVQELKSVLIQMKSMIVAGPQKSKTESEAPSALDAYIKKTKFAPQTSTYSQFMASAGTSKSTDLKTTLQKTPNLSFGIQGSGLGRVKEPLENPDDEVTLKKFMKILGMGENNLQTLGDRVAIGTMVLEVCKGMEDEEFEDIKSGKKKTSDTRKVVIAKVKEMLAEKAKKQPGKN